MLVRDVASVAGDLRPWRVIDIFESRDERTMLVLAADPEIGKHLPNAVVRARYGLVQAFDPHLPGSVESLTDDDGA